MQDQTEAERIGREAGEAIANAIADNIEAVIMRLADSIAEIKVEQRRQHEALVDWVASHRSLRKAFVEHLEDPNAR